MLYADVSEHCLFHLHFYLPMKMKQTECSETLAYKTTKKKAYNANIFGQQSFLSYAI